MEGVKDKLIKLIQSNTGTVDIFCAGVEEKVMNIFVRMR